MHANANYPIAIDFKKYESSFKDSIKSIIEKIMNIFHRFEESPKKMEDDFYEKIILEIKESASLISKSIKENHILEMEYYEFREIERLLDESLDKGNEEGLKIILEILEEFKKITEFKFNLLNQCSIDKETMKRFEREYDEFSKFLFNCEMAYCKNQNHNLHNYFKLLESKPNQDKKAINKIRLFLKEIIPKFGLEELEYDEEESYEFTPTLIIKVPDEIPSKKMNECWDKIIEEVFRFAESANEDFILDDLSIILWRDCNE